MSWPRPAVAMLVYRGVSQAPLLLRRLQPGSGVRHFSILPPKPPKGHTILPPKGYKAKMKAPKGYFLPRLAVFSVSTAGAYVLYELIRETLAWGSGAAAIRDFGQWNYFWDTGVDGETKQASEASTAALAAAKRIREASDPNVERRHVIFIRHAQPASSEEASSPGPLSSVGMKQVEVTGKRLRELFDEEVTTVYHSGAPEAKATAEALRRILGQGKGPSAGPQVVESELLAEGMPVLPSPSSLRKEDIEEKELQTDAARADGAFRAHIWRPSGGDDGEGKTTVEVVVGHGNVIRYLICRALQLPESSWSRLAACHCTITWVDIDCSGVVLLHEFGGTGHLPPDALTYH